MISRASSLQVSKCESGFSAGNWQYHIVSALLFVVRQQCRLLLLPVMLFLKAVCYLSAITGDATGVSSIGYLD